MHLALLEGVRGVSVQRPPPEGLPALVPPVALHWAWAQSLLPAPIDSALPRIFSHAFVLVADTGPLAPRAKPPALRWGSLLWKAWDRLLGTPPIPLSTDMMRTRTPGGRLMRAVAMSLKMEIIFFTKMYHPSDGTDFRSVSTYLETNRSGCPCSNPQGVMVRSYHLLPDTHLLSQSGSCVTSLNGHHPIAREASWPGT